MARKLKIMENEKHPLDDLKNDEITFPTPQPSVGGGFDHGGLLHQHHCLSDEA